MAWKKILAVITSQSLISLAIILLIQDTLYAQSRSAFESLEIGLRYVVNTNRNVFHDFWIPGRGVDGYLELPFYYGDVQAGIHVLPYSGRKAGIPNFQSVFIYLGWGKTWILPFRLKWFNGFSVGSNIMIFDAAEGYTKQESELGFGLNSRLKYALYKKWAIGFSGSYKTIFTYKPIKLTFISVGLSYSTTTPKWMRAFLE